MPRHWPKKRMGIGGVAAAARACRGAQLRKTRRCPAPPRRRRELRSQAADVGGGDDRRRHCRQCPKLTAHGLHFLVNHTPSTRMEIRTWRSAIADLKGPPPGAPSDALGEGTPGWVWRCDAAISRYHKTKHSFLYVFHVQPKHPNGAIFVNTEGFWPCLSKPSYGAPQWALMVRLMQKERHKSPRKSQFYEPGLWGHFGHFGHNMPF